MWVELNKEADAAARNAALENEEHLVQPEFTKIAGLMYMLIGWSKMHTSDTSEQTVPRMKRTS